MDRIKFDVLFAEGCRSFKIDNVWFSYAIVVQMEILNKNPDFLTALREAIVVVSELKKSVDDDGVFLIITSANGVADSGGWCGVNVAHLGSVVLWSLDFNDSHLCFEFEQKEYCNWVDKIVREIESHPDLKLQPEQVFFPENWPAC